MTHCNGKKHFQIKMYGLKGVSCDSLCHTTASTTRLVYSFLYVSLVGFGFFFVCLFVLGDCFLSFWSFVNFVLFCGAGCKSWRVDMKARENGWDQHAWYETHKEWLNKNRERGKKLSSKYLCLSSKT